MTTSGTTSYNLKAREIIEYALEKINIVAKGEPLDVRQSKPAMRELNVMLKEWMVYPAIWRITEGFVNLAANEPSYSLTPRPYRIIDMRFRQASGIDIPMQELTREEYYDLPLKTSKGPPTQWFFDPQQATSSVYIWPVPATVTTETLRVTYQRFIEDVTDLDQTVDITSEWLATLGYNLAARIADDYSRSGEAINRIIARAEALFDKMQDHDRPEIIRFVPERRYGARR